MLTKKKSKKEKFHFESSHENQIEFESFESSIESWYSIFMETRNECQPNFVCYCRSQKQASTVIMYNTYMYTCLNMHGV